MRLRFLDALGSGLAPPPWTLASALLDLSLLQRSSLDRRCMCQPHCAGWQPPRVQTARGVDSECILSMVCDFQFCISSYGDCFISLMMVHLY